MRMKNIITGSNSSVTQSSETKHVEMVTSFLWLISQGSQGSNSAVAYEKVVSVSIKFPFHIIYGIFLDLLHQHFLVQTHVH